ncbi:MAG TPA: hypothetical protein VJX66_18680 [Amycolatopsis sp.]|nr:hypothetical protein [Amycolatopsis sp.]
MGKLRGSIAATLLLVCVAGCSGTPIADPPASSSAPTTLGRPTTSAPTTTRPTAPPFTPLASPTKVAAACPFLGAGEVQQLIGTSEEITASEQPADPTYVPHTEFQCRYTGEHGGLRKLDLWIVASAHSYAPAKAIENSKHDCRGPVTSLPGIGEGAIYCDLAAADTDAMVMVGKRVHGQNRTATLYLIKNSTEVYTALAQMLADRL